MGKQQEEAAGGGDQYNWQKGDAKAGSGFQLIHLIITAIVCLFIGGYLGGSHDAIKGEM